MSMIRSRPGEAWGRLLVTRLNISAKRLGFPSSCVHRRCCSTNPCVKFPIQQKKKSTTCFAAQLCTPSFLDCHAEYRSTDLDRFRYDSDCCLLSRCNKDIYLFEREKNKPPPTQHLALFDFKTLKDELLPENKIFFYTTLLSATLHTMTLVISLLI